MTDGIPPSEKRMPLLRVDTEQLMRPLMVDAKEYDVQRLLIEWRWLLPTTYTPPLC